LYDIQKRRGIGLAPFPEMGIFKEGDHRAMSATACGKVETTENEFGNCQWPSVANRWLSDLQWDSLPPVARSETWLGIIASHSHREESRRWNWQRNLDSALVFAKEQGATILFSGESPYADTIRHACMRLELPHRELTFHAPNGEERISKYLQLRFREGQNRHRKQSQMCDAALAILSHHLFVLQLRPKGKVEALLRSRLAEPEVTAGTTLVMIEPERKRNPMRCELALSQCGAILWMHPAADHGQSSRTSGIAIPNAFWGCRNRIAPATLQPTIGTRWHRVCEGEFMVHCTRGRSGPWPNQSWQDYLDEAFQGECEGTGTVLETLARILSTQRLIGTQRLRRGDARTVCFSEQSLDVLLSKREFQSHLSRWDWEPYGIAIRKSCLVIHGARPVQYLHPTEIARCDTEELPYVQPASDSSHGRDWSFEREWRMAGDLRLTKIAFEDAFVFVPSQEEAALISHLSRWPVVVTNG
jgi:hypothetical protein